MNTIVVFTLHKSASMLLHRHCESLCRIAGIDYHSPNLPASGLSARMLLTDPEIWRSRRGCIAPVRFWADLPESQDFSILLHLRDPRDVLVSMFYSYCYIHAGEIAPATGYRMEAIERGIDAFVLAKSGANDFPYPGDYGTGGHLEPLIGNVPTRYRRYLDRLLGRRNVTLLRYEEMVTDYRAWLEKFVRPFPLVNPVLTVEEMSARSGELFPARRTDQLTHVRHIAPGDHRLKLRRETIERLNEIYADVLGALGYERDAPRTPPARIEAQAVS
jgi:hypothetical protein